MALIFKLSRGCDYLHQGAPQFPSNLLCCEISESEWLWDSVSAGYWVPKQSCRQVTESGRQRSFRINGPGSFRIKARPSFRIRACIWAVAKFLSPRAWKFPNESSCKLSNLPLKFPNPGGGEFPNRCTRKFPNPTLKFPNPKLAIRE